MHEIYLESHSKIIGKRGNKNVSVSLSEMPNRELSAVAGHWGSADTKSLSASPFNFLKFYYYLLTLQLVHACMYVWFVFLLVCMNLGIGITWCVCWVQIASFGCWSFFSLYRFSSLLHKPEVSDLEAIGDFLCLPLISQQKLRLELKLPSTTFTWVPTIQNKVTRFMQEGLLTLLGVSPTL